MAERTIATPTALWCIHRLIVDPALPFLKAWTVATDGEGRVYCFDNRETAQNWLHEVRKVNPATKLKIIRLRMNPKPATTQEDTWGH